MAGRLANAFAALVLSILLALFISTGILGVPSRVSRLLRVLPNATRVEPQFTTDFSFIIHWASAWDDYSALRDAPLGDILADLVEALDQHQNPVDCAKVSYLIFEYRTALGFGSQIRHIIAAFYTALQTDRVFVLSDGLSFYWANGCPDKANNRRFICHFRPLSQTCPFSRVKKLIDGGRIPVFDANYSSAGSFALNNAGGGAHSALRFSQKKMGKRFSDFLHSFPYQDDFVEQVKRLVPSAPLDVLKPEAHARRLWLSAAAFYTTRLNNRVAARVRSEVEKALIANGRPGPPRLIGVPVRASDKCYDNRKHPGPGEMTCMTLEETADVVMRLALMQPELTHVIITSEDAGAISEDKVRDAFGGFPFRKPLHVVRYVEDVQPGTGHTNRVLKKLGKKQAQLLDSMLIVLHMQALAEFHVLTPRSTFHSLIAALANTTPGKKRHVTFPLGTWRDLNSSIGSQLVR